MSYVIQYAYMLNTKLASSEHAVSVGLCVQPTNLSVAMSRLGMDGTLAPKIALLKQEVDNLRLRLSHETQK